MNEQRRVPLQGHAMTFSAGMIRPVSKGAASDCRTGASGMDWKEAIRQWRALPEEERQRLRRESIPGKVARSFAFEGEPVVLAMLEAELARHPIPPVRANPAAME